jgi:hypothetical protein
MEFKVADNSPSSHVQFLTHSLFFCCSLKKLQDLHELAILTCWQNS